MTARANLRAVETAPVEPSPDLSYEARERRHIMSRPWDRLHVEADRRVAMEWFERKGGWLK